MRPSRLAVALFALAGVGCAHTTTPFADVHAVEPEAPPDAAEPKGAEPEKPGAIIDNSKKTASLETSGYTDSDHVTVFTPSLNAGIENVVDGASLRGSYLVDVVSAASVDIVATASRRWKEVRHAGTLAGEYKPRDLGVGFAGSVSSEPDYFSYGFSGHLSYDVNEKNTSLFFGYGYGHDTAGRGGTPFTVFARTLLRGSFLAGFDQVVGPSTLASVAFTAIIENGDQSKPYRYIPLFSPSEAANVPQGASIDYVNAHRTFERPLEQLPLSRRRFALGGQLAQRFDASTLRGSERFYIDNWGLKASTTDVRWFFDVGNRFRIWPHGRFHLQTPVVFWKRAYTSDEATGWSLPELRTGDRELGPLWTGTGGAGVKLFLGSAAHPRVFAIRIEGDAMYTAYSDDLYLTSRTGFLGAITFEIGGEE